MVGDRNRKLRRLAKSYRITFRLPSDDWPAAHSPTFHNIKKLGSQNFDSYCENISIRSQEEPWTEKTKTRAEWLSKRASRLFGQERNEAGWRFGLENDILRRFSVEVACSKCRARVWRSEIEARLDVSGDITQTPEQRKRDRQRCQCPPESRPQDYYEIGTNLLFDDRTQELIIHDLTVRSELLNQEPDRIYGLQATRNFEDLLSRSIPSTTAGTAPTTVGDLIRSSPFKSESDPLLFPFLVLEAKSESSSDGFDDIQTQTAFPIWALLKLQEDLQLQVGAESHSDPLVWFFASRGDVWRVYGCHVIRGANNEPARYDINLLWNGSITFKDNALQLILIVDYIMDWARDVYRPSILRQLKSIATGKPYDEVSVATDSDIFSMRRNISNWIPAPPSTINALEYDVDQSNPVIVLEHQDILPINVPNTTLGLIRSSLITEFRFFTLHITQSNVTSLLQLARGRNESEENSARVARELINFITRWDEMLLLTTADLDELEQSWTGERPDDSIPDSSPENFYVLLEYACFISSSWEITKEISCLAISESAFDFLMSYANFKIRHRPAERLPNTLRSCPRDVFRECVQCLRSGSPWQVLVSAISCTLVSLYPVPERKRTDFTPPVDHLEFGSLSYRRIKPFVRKYLYIGEAKLTRANRQAPRNSPKQSHKTEGSRLNQAKSNRSIIDLSFRRVSEKKVYNCDEAHDMDKCGRCRQRSGNDQFQTSFSTIKPLVLSTYGSILVESQEFWKGTEYSRNPNTRHDLCLFIVEKSHYLEEEEALPLVIEDILQTNMLYHTIRHSLDDDGDTVKAIAWHLPSPYRPPTEEQRADVMDWCQEILGVPAVKKSQSEDSIGIYDSTQILLYFLQLGYSYLDAKGAVTKFCENFPDEIKALNEERRRHSSSNILNPNKPPTLWDFHRHVDREKGTKIRFNTLPLFPPTILSLRGNETVEASND